MRETFYVDGKQLFDPTGNKVLLRGVNKMSVWDANDPTGAIYFPEIRKTQANTVRIVWAITKNLKPTGEKTDLDVLDTLITNARKNQLIPVIELHDALGNWQRLQEIVDYWLKPEVVKLIQKHQAYLLVNIGNEVGDETVKSAQFLAGYKKAVERMRTAGIHTPLVIDASDWGKDLKILDANADKLITADPDKNLIFSVHTYWSISAGADADFIQSKFKPKVERKFPLIIGEFSKYGGYAGIDEDGHPISICSSFGEINYQTILQIADEKDIGYYAWEWGPGNAQGEPPDELCVVMDMTPDGKFENLKEGWATDVVASIKAASEKPDYFTLPPIIELPPAVKIRIETLRAVLNNKTQQNAVSQALQKANGVWSIALAHLTDNKTLPKEALRKVVLAHSLAEWSDDNVPLVTTLAKKENVTNLRDVALNFNVAGLIKLVAPGSTEGDPAHDTAKTFAVGLRQKLFATETTAVLQRMVQDTEIPVADTKVKIGITQFLNNQPEFNIRTTSLYTVLQEPNIFKDIAEEQQAGVIEHMKSLQRIQALTFVPEAVPVLMNANLTSAFHVGEMPESTFLRLHGEALGGEQVARDIHYNAINNRIRNEQALMVMQESIRGTGLAIMDGQETKEVRMAALNRSLNKILEPTPKKDIAVPDPGPEGVPMMAHLDSAFARAGQQPSPLNLEALFGSTDYCECNECQSVYSPASYFVELLQYLRNNNLDPNSANPGQSNPNIHPGLKGTPLEKLFRRRPDLGCLELTCENTFTVLPYIDLVNEVMESFVVHLDDYSKSTEKPQQATLEAFNVEDETTSELLAEPQHTNYQAYCILKSAVYPFTLPYHQPIDAIRIFLNYLGTSRYELLDTYRTAHEACRNTTLSTSEQQEIQTIHEEVQQRAVDAEFLGLTQEEYIILTKEAFWRKRYFDINQKVEHTSEEYQQKIGVKPVHEYYGYDTHDLMMDVNEDPNTGRKGLSFVKKQFLPRTGIQYTDLVELLKTQFINPNFPQGKALVILESIRFSYRFLHIGILPGNDPKTRFAKIVEFLEQTLPFLLQPEADVCKKQSQHCPEITSKELRDWVYCYFDRIGKLIVLESGEGPRLPIEGQLYKSESRELIGALKDNGEIVDTAGTIMGNVNAMTEVVLLDGTSFHTKFGQVVHIKKDENSALIGSIHGNKVYGNVSDFPLNWLLPRDTCTLDKVRLIHLDGSPVTEPEYDGIHRFIRLWRKLGWTIDETDKALTGLVKGSNSDGTEGTSGGTDVAGEVCEFVGFDVFIDNCPAASDNSNEDCGSDNKPPVDDPVDKGDCPKPLPINTTIAPEFLHQGVAVKKLLDLTGLPLIRLLAFWADISTAGEKSLYSRLFLTHNLLGIDKVFKADANGNYLTEAAKITDHLPVLMAALKLKADDITAIMGFAVPPLTDELKLRNVSVLYRYSLLAKILHVPVAELPDVIALFSTVSGNPFQSAWYFLSLIETWGKMEDAGFSCRQLNYIIRDKDDKLRPLAPSKRTILQITKTLYDGLTGIDRDHKDILEADKDKVTADVVRAKAGLLFEASVVGL